jgi:hypothetical protein
MQPNPIYSANQYAKVGWAFGKSQKALAKSKTVTDNRNILEDNDLN